MERESEDSDESKQVDKSPLFLKGRKKERIRPIMKIKSPKFHLS